ncbi:MAG TPA: hypothetical protein VFU03_08800 [Gemmatimonadales bacterium]|nr:hypothetical protein [Gemmatimonadales bacterium]
MSKNKHILTILAIALALTWGCSGSLSRPQVTKTVPAGTALHLELVDSVSSASSSPGDAVQARVTRDVLVDGKVAIPANATVSGHVVSARGLKKIGGRALLSLAFTTVETSAGEAPIQAAWSALGKSETKKDVATIAGSTAGGAILGRVIDKRDEARGTLIGGIVGGAAGTGIAAATKGHEIQLGPGTHLTVSLQTPVTVELET